MSNSEPQVVLVVTLGQRDVTLNGEAIKPPREKGKEVLEDFQSYSSQLDYPILKPALEMMRREHTTIDRLIFVVTDQKNEQFRKGDTLYFADILEKLLKADIGIGKSHPIQDVRRVKVAQGIPFLDEMHRFWEDTFKRNKVFKDLDRNTTRLYVLPVGGIDAINTTLLLRGIMEFRQNCVQIYVPEGKREAVPLNFGQQVLWSLEREIILNRLAHFDYATVVSLLSDESHRKLRWMAQYAQHRLYFNLDESYRIANKLIQEYPSERDFFLQMRREIHELTGLEHKIRELLFNAWAKLINEEYVDFLLRIFRVRESILRWLVEKELEIPTEPAGKGDFSRFEKAVSAFAELADFLSKQTYSGNPLSIERPDVPVLMAIVKFMLTENRKDDGTCIWNEQEKASFQAVFQILEQLEPIADLRNKSVGAHGFEGVSLQKLEKPLGKHVDIFLKELAGYLKVSLDSSVYHRINDYVQRELS